MQRNCKYDDQSNISQEATHPITFHDRFVWNRFLIQPFFDANSHPRWILPIIHGYFHQTICSLAEKTFSITLIARRSRHYAGVRYLKRGINEEGNVANEVETEQVVQVLHQGTFFYLNRLNYR